MSIYAHTYTVCDMVGLHCLLKCKIAFSRARVVEDAEASSLNWMIHFDKVVHSLKQQRLQKLDVKNHLASQH